MTDTIDVTVDQLVELDDWTALAPSSFVLDITQEPLCLKVNIPSSATNVRISFAPVSIEEVRQTKELNRASRLGFVPPLVSTR